MKFKKKEPKAKAVAECAGPRGEGVSFLPNVLKYVAWSFVVAIIITSSVVLAYFGMPLNMIKVYSWMTFLILSVCMSVLAIAPIRIYLFTVINMLYIKRKPIIVKKKLLKCFLENPENSVVKKQVLRFRQYNASLYAPIPLWKLQSLKEDVKYNIQLRNLTLDIMSQAFVLITILALIRPYFSEMGYYNNNVVERLILNGNYTKSIPFSRVTTYEMLMEYLRETFIPAVLKKPTEYDNTFRKEWITDSNLKLFGKPRIRQIRVKADPCRQLIQLAARNIECASDLTVFNIEKGDFSLKWDPSPSKELTPWQAVPWKHQSMFSTKSLPLFGRFFIYPASGYVLDLARNAKDTLVIVKFAEEFQWIDTRTRAVFIEFTLYCVNTNVFSIVTLIAEKTSLGYFVTSNQIFSNKLLFSHTELDAVFTLKSFLFICLLLTVLVREGFRVHRTSILPYLKRGFALLDLTVIILGFAFIFGGNYYVPLVLKKLEGADEDEFVNLTFASTWDYWSKIIKALLVTFSTVRLFGVLSFRVSLFKSEATLIFCYKYFFSFFIQKLILTFAFAFFFNLSLGHLIYQFSNFSVSVLTMMLRSIPTEDQLDFSRTDTSPWHLASLLSIFSIIPGIVLFHNVSIALVCLYLQQVQKLPLVNKYDIFLYLRYILTRQGDILYRKEREVEVGGPAVMRLKGGGGNVPSKEKRKKKKNENGKCKRAKEAFALKMKAKDFVTKSLFDRTEYQDLAADRALAMKLLTLSLLQDKRQTRVCLRRKALAALFCSVADGKRKERTRRTSPGPYYLANVRNSIEVHDRRRFSKMKRVVEGVAKCKEWLEEEEEGGGVRDELSEAENKLFILNKKLCRLVKDKRLL